VLKIDAEYLRDVGLGALPTWEQNVFLKHVYETLEMRVGVVLADQMTNSQLDEFEAYFKAKDDAGAFKWLSSNFPNYKEIVALQHDELKAEVTRLAPEIMRISAADPQASPEPAPLSQDKAGERHRASSTHRGARLGPKRPPARGR
jgi:hypothetical protein